VSFCKRCFPTAHDDDRIRRAQLEAGDRAGSRVSSTIPGGLGLLYLARGLAQLRVRETVSIYWHPLPRELPHKTVTATSREYYAILDRIGRGEKP
jgi:hypothetical protein